MKTTVFKRAAAMFLALLMLPSPVRAAEPPAALPDTTQKDNVQTYYVDQKTAHTIYWAQGITPPRMTADDTKFGTADYFYRELRNTDAGIYVTYQAPNMADQGYFDLNGNPEAQPQEKNLGDLAAAGNVLHWWLQQNSDYIDQYLQKLAANALQQPEGLMPLTPVDQELWEAIRAVPEITMVEGVGNAQELANSLLMQKNLPSLLGSEQASAADLVWDYFLNGFAVQQEEPNTAESFPEHMDSTGGYFYPVFGAEPLSRRTNDSTYAYYNENLSKLLNDGHGLVVTCTDEKTAHALTIWGAEYDANNKLARIYVTASDDGLQMVGDTQDVRAIYSLEAHEGEDGDLLLTTNADPDSGEGVKPDSLSILSLGQELWEEKLARQPVTAAAPEISAQPQSASYIVGDTAAALSVAAAVTDGGSLSYQWYVAENATDPGDALNDTNSSELQIFTDSPADGYYYCVVTNTLEGKTAQVTSERARITIAARTEASAPVISAQPQSASYTVGDTAAALSVAAAVTDGGSLSYQWYVAENATDPGDALNDTNSSELQIFTDSPADGYYYCVVTNTLEGKTAQVTSERARITIAARQEIVVTAPVISDQPKSAAYAQGDTAVDLTVTAEAAEGTVLSYQWYIAEDNTEPGKAIAKATENSLKLSTAQVGKAYFYCVVTASSTEDATRTADAVSARAEITVTEKEAAKPVIKTQPQSAEYLVGDKTEALSLKAESPDDGKLSYQWYAADSASAEGKPIEDATGETLAVRSDKAGVTYYYCAVTNTAADNKTKTAVSDKAKITVKEKASLAAEPDIKTQPVSDTYTLHDETRTLTVKAESTDGGKLTYQWYRASGTTGAGTAIKGATGTSWQPASDQIGISYYYCLVTNTKGKEAAARESERAKITVTAPTSAKAPQISAQPKDAAYIVGDTAADLSVSATSLDGGKLSYQWYASDTETGKGTAIKDAAGSSFRPSTEKIGVTYYYCVVTNTNAADKDLKATATTNSAKVTVKKAEQVLVKRDLTKVEPSLEKAGFQSVTSIEKEMMKALPKRSTPYGAVYYDICLEKILADGSRVPATEFPESGLTFTLSYPKGTQKKGFDFVAVHMIASGSKAGTVELPKIRLTNDGIQMTLTSLSPVMIAWTETDSSKPAETTKPPKKPDSPSTGDSTPVGLLVGVVLVSGAALAAAAWFVFRKKKD